MGVHKPTPPPQVEDINHYSWRSWFSSLYNSITVSDGLYNTLLTSYNDLTTLYNNIHVQEDFIAPTLLNSWANYGDSYNSAGYMIDSLGLVHLRGRLRSGTVGPSSVIFVLPVGYRPSNIYILPVSATSSAGTCRVDAYGNVIAYSSEVASAYASPYADSSTWFSLDNITFKAV